jgi:LAS superfamily LD-carboxypeptidase LdcB
VSKSTQKLILAIILLIVVSIPVITSSVLDFKEKKVNELVRQKELVKALAQINAEKKVYLMGQFDPGARSDFTQIPLEYTVVRNTIYLRKETLSAFLKMADAADKDVIDLKVASATRNFDYQKNIWDNKWSGMTLVDGEDLSKSITDGLERFKKILEYSAAPGTSRHHWGTDVDINNANAAYFQTEVGRKVYAWLTQNAASFGFCQPYTLKGSARPTGYNEEKWHWSYKPLAKTFLEDYKNLISEKDITGFSGDQYVIGQDLIKDYVLAINPNCF